MLIPRLHRARIYRIPADTSPRPTVTGVSPSTGSEVGGTLVTVTGTGFMRPQGNLLEVRFGDTPGTDLVVASDTSATVLTPAGSGLVTVWARGPGGQEPLFQSYTYTVAANVILTEIGVNLQTEAGSDLLTES